jgi:cytoskeletal protein CcmA (bactofilin family)
VWKKKEPEPVSPAPVSKPQPPVARPAQSRPERAIIGPTLRIHGEVSGEEDLLVQGRIDGKIVVKGQSVTIGKQGVVHANIHARSIRVEGQVRGDLFGDQDVVIEASGNVEGNLIAPSVRLENGSRFKGSIDMEKAQQQAPRPAVPSRPAGTDRQPQPRSTPSPPGQPPQKS